MTNDAKFMMPTLQALEAEGKVEKLEIAELPVMHYKDIPCLIVSYKVLK